jgi:hypothetical protein
MTDQPNGVPPETRQKLQERLQVLINEALAPTPEKTPAQVFMDTVETAAHCCAYYGGGPPKTLYVNPAVLQKLSVTGLWELPQVQQAQVSGSYRVLRKLRLASGVVDVIEDRNELLFRFE